MLGRRRQPQRLGCPIRGLNIQSDYLAMSEMSPPEAAPLTQVRISVRYNNATDKTELCARFNTGAIQVIAAEP